MGKIRVLILTGVNNHDWKRAAPFCKDLLKKTRIAKMQGYEGDSCGECGNFTLVRNGTCLKCNTCGATSGCS